MQKALMEYLLLGRLDRPTGGRLTVLTGSQKHHNGFFLVYPPWPQP